MIRLESLLTWLSKLMPKQKMRDVGHANVQAGEVAGDVVSDRSITINTFYVSGPAPTERADTEPPPAASKEPAPEAAQRPVPATPASAPPPQTERRTEVDPPEVIELRRKVFDWLRKFERMPCGSAPLKNFMQREFQTTTIMQLDRVQLIRVNAWCAKVHKERVNLARTRRVKKGKAA